MGAVPLDEAVGTYVNEGPAKVVLGGNVPDSEMDGLGVEEDVEVEEEEEATEDSLTVELTAEVSTPYELPCRRTRRPAASTGERMAKRVRNADAWKCMTDGTSGGMRTASDKRQKALDEIDECSRGVSTTCSGEKRKKRRARLTASRQRCRRYYHARNKKRIE